MWPEALAAPRGINSLEKGRVTDSPWRENPLNSSRETLAGWWGEVWCSSGSRLRWTPRWCSGSGCQMSSHRLPRLSPANQICLTTDKHSSINNKCFVGRVTLILCNCTAVSKKTFPHVLLWWRWLRVLSKRSVKISGSYVQLGWDSVTVKATAYDSQRFPSNQTISDPSRPRGRGLYHSGGSRQNSYSSIEKFRHRMKVNTFYWLTETLCSSWTYGPRTRLQNATKQINKVTVCCFSHTITRIDVSLVRFWKITETFKLYVSFCCNSTFVQLQYWFLVLMLRLGLGKHYDLA